ncbi:HAAS signaling domain-containing protein [Actinoplanes sp. NPDC004185]
MTSVPHHYDTTPLAHTDVLVLDYLAALWGASEDLAPELRDELMTTVADYIAMRRTSVADPLEDPRHILHRLGPPEALAAAARRGRMPAHLRRPVLPAPLPPPAATSSAGPEYAGIALLTAGSVVLPVISPLAGLMLVSGSPRWSPAQKTAAWVLAGLPVLLGFVMVIGAAAFGGGEAAVLLAYLGMVAGAIIAGLSLLPGLAARRRY